MARALSRRHFGHAGRLAVAVGGGAFLDIADIQNRLRCQKLQHPPAFALIRRDFNRAGGLAIFQSRQRATQERVLLDRFLIAAANLCESGWPSASRSNSISAIINSVSMVSASATGSILPSTWVTIIILQSSAAHGQSRRPRGYSPGTGFPGLRPCWPRAPARQYRQRSSESE